MKSRVQFGESTFSFAMNPRGQQASSAGSVAVRDQATLTSDQYFADAQTTTKAETAEVGTKTVHAGQDPDNEDEYYSDDEGVHRPQAEFDMGALEAFIEKVEPRMRQHLATNSETRAFENYEVMWEEERGEIN